MTCGINKIISSLSVLMRQFSVTSVRISTPMNLRYKKKNELAHSESFSLLLAHYLHTLLLPQFSCLGVGPSPAAAWGPHQQLYHQRKMECSSSKLQLYFSHLGQSWVKWMWGCGSKTRSIEGRGIPGKQDKQP